LAIAVALIAGGAIYGLPQVFARYLDRPLAVRIAISVVLLAPVGLTLGMFLPLGMRAVEAVDRRLIPWAWAVNGFATVIGTIIAVMLGMAYGFNLVMWLAAGIYLVGAVALRKSRGA
jgi:hypothetical protein